MNKKEPCEAQLEGRKRHSCISEGNKRLAFNVQHQKSTVFCGEKKEIKEEKDGFIGLFPFLSLPHFYLQF